MMLFDIWLIGADPTLFYWPESCYWCFVEMGMNSQNGGLSWFMVCQGWRTMNDEFPHTELMNWWIGCLGLSKTRTMITEPPHSLLLHPLSTAPPPPYLVCHCHIKLFFPLLTCWLAPRHLCMSLLISWLVGTHADGPWPAERMNKKGKYLLLCIFWVSRRDKY